MESKETAPVLAVNAVNGTSKAANSTSIKANATSTLVHTAAVVASPAKNATLSQNKTNSTVTFTA